MDKTIYPIPDKNFHHLFMTMVHAISYQNKIPFRNENWYELILEWTTSHKGVHIPL